MGGSDLVERDDVSVKDTPRRAAWAAEFALYVTEAADHLRKTAIEAERLCSEALIEKDQEKPVGAEERRLIARTRSMSHASALLALLAIEIALKGYQIRDCGRHQTHHCLQKLFDSLKEETKARLKELGPEVTETLRKYQQGFVSLRYQFEELGNDRSVVIPRPSDPLHAVAMQIVEALIEEPSIQQVVAVDEAPARGGAPCERELQWLDIEGPEQA